MTEEIYNGRLRFLCDLQHVNSRSSAISLSIPRLRCVKPETRFLDAGLTPVPLSEANDQVLRCAVARGNALSLLCFLRCNAILDY